MEGGKDPFNRRTYPWGKENAFLLAFYSQLGKLRAGEESLRLGKLEFSYASDGLLHFIRRTETETLHIYVNRSCDPWDIAPGNVIFGSKIMAQGPSLLRLAPMGLCITKEK